MEFSTVWNILTFNCLINILLTPLSARSVFKIFLKQCYLHAQRNCKHTTCTTDRIDFYNTDQRINACGSGENEEKTR